MSSGASCRLAFGYKHDLLLGGKRLLTPSLSWQPGHYPYECSVFARPQGYKTQPAQYLSTCTDLFAPPKLATEGFTLAQPDLSRNSNRNTLGFLSNRNSIEIL